MPEVKTLPTTQDIMEAIPAGRRAYVIASAELSRPQIEFDNWQRPHIGTVSLFGLRRAVHALAEANASGELVPPLPETLGFMIEDMSARAKAKEEECYGESDVWAGARTFVTNEYRAAAELAIRAAVDHGFRQI